MPKIVVDEKAWEIAMWEIHLRRILLEDLIANVRAANKMIEQGFGEYVSIGRLQKIVEEHVVKMNEVFSTLRLRSLDELREARLNGFRFKEKQ